MSADRFNDGYAAAEAHWKKRWYAANADHQAAVTENEHLRADLIRVNAECHGLLSDVEAERDALAARLAAVKAAFENLPIFLSAIESDLRRTPEGRGGEVHFIPATPGHGKSGCPGDNITCWLDEVRAALSAAPTDTTKETS